MYIFIIQQVIDGGYECGEVRENIKAYLDQEKADAVCKRMNGDEEYEEELRNLVRNRIEEIRLLPDYLITHKVKFVEPHPVYGQSRLMTTLNVDFIEKEKLVVLTKFGLTEEEAKKFITTRMYDTRKQYEVEALELC